MLKKSSLYLLAAILLTTTDCKKKASRVVNADLTVKLETVIDSTNIFDLSYTDLHFKSYYKLYPEFYASLLDQYDGIFETDTCLIVNYFYDPLRFWYYLNKQGYMNDSDFKKEVLNFNIDTIKYANTKIQDELTAFVGLKGNTEIVVVDNNNNKSFSDDQVLKFSRSPFYKNSEENSSKSKKTTYLDYNYEFYDKGQLTKYKRKIEVRPSPNDPYTQFFQDSLIKDLYIMGRLKDYWKGSLNYKNEKYTIFCQGFIKEYLQIFIKPDSIELSENNQSYNKNFEYHIKDTVTLSNELFVIDTITDGLSNLVLKNIVPKNLHYGFRIGETLDNLELENLNSQKFKLSEVQLTDKYTLIDFWGTWCGPCRKTMPLLKKMHDKNANSIKMVSIAYDENMSEVKEYVDTNNLDWTHAFVKKRYDAPLIEKLRIDVFPTFILIDRNNKIVLRGGEIEILERINSLLNNGS